MDERTRRIQELNDIFRITLQGGRFMMTARVQALPLEVSAWAIRRMRAFSDFAPENDPHGEHDFGSFEEGGHRFFWKVDYYNKDMTAGSEDPSDPEETTRVLTLMLAEEY